jgi:large subunit ribosomal protein L4
MKNLKITVIDTQGKIAGEASLALDSEVGGAAALVTQAVRAFLANQRRARAHAKTRGEVSGTTAKVWRQKGTGRARHGARKAPIFVGGGVAHGPTGTQNYRQRLSQKASQKAILSVLADKAREKRLFLVKDFGFKKTKEAAAFLAQVRESQKAEGKVAFLLAKSEAARRFLANLSGVEVLSTESLNAYFLLRADIILASEAALKALESRFEGRKTNDTH